jgi:hypothetical protein
MAAARVRRTRYDSTRDHSTDRLSKASVYRARPPRMQAIIEIAFQMFQTLGSPQQPQQPQSDIAQRTARNRTFS